MALFGIGKKKKEGSLPQIPSPPKPDSAGVKVEMPRIEIPAIAPRHIDDLEKPLPKPGKADEGLPLFPEMPKLDLPEIEAPENGEPEELPPAMPKLPEELPPLIPKMPEISIPDITKEKTAPQLKKTEIAEELPEKLPELEEIELPKEIPEELPALENEIHRPRKRAPIFMNVNAYADMVSQLNVTRAKLTEYVSAASRVMEIRAKKEDTMEKWRNALEDIERKLLQVDYVMFEQGSAGA